MPTQGLILRISNNFLTKSTPGVSAPLAIRGSRRLMVLLAAAMFVLPLGARAQFLSVDCSGADPSAFPTINSALPFAGPGAFIAVTGTCTEDVFLYGFNNLTLGAFFGQAVTLNGNLTIYNSQLVYLYGLNVTNPNGDGFDVFSSRSVVLDTCMSNGNAGSGLFASDSSDVAVNTLGGFSDNGGYGIFVGSNSYVNIVSWAGTTEISSNQVSALWVGQGNFSTSGNTHIANSGSAVAIDMRGGGKAQFGAALGPNVIEGNPKGGVSLQENSEISFWSVLESSAPNTLSNNGPFGVQAGFGSQVTLAGALITGHTGPGVDIYAHSQLYATSQIPGLSATQISNNGSGGDPLSAGIRVDGNSEALLRGVNVSQNRGPAILALVNSSADFTGMTFSGNAGVITCDSTSSMVTDLAAAAGNPASGLRCMVAHMLGNRRLRPAAPSVPNSAAWKTMHENYHQRSSAHK